MLAPVAQLDRVADFESEGCRFESCRARCVTSWLSSTCVRQPFLVFSLRRHLQQICSRICTQHLSRNCSRTLQEVIANSQSLIRGTKHLLGSWPGATENSQVCGQLLDELIERGLSPQQRYLFIPDGSKALAKAVKARFGRQVLIQRCRLHKERNVQKYLPKKYHKVLAMKLRAAWGMTDCREAKEQLYKVHDWLACINQGAASSLDEGFEETLTVNRLGLPEQLRKLFSSTSIIESCFSLADDLCRNVKHWRDANMAWRWAGTVLPEAERRFHRIKGH